MRAIWSGSISFGLINVPVRLFSASEEHPITFDLLHKADLSPIRYAKICKEEEKEIPYSEIVKGYEYQPGQYIVVDDEVLKKAHEEKVKSIDIMHFAFINEVDSIYFEKPYYLEPGKGGDKAYALLREVLKSSKKAAIVKFVIRNKEHLGILKEYNNVIVLDQMRFAEEMRSTSELKIPSAKIINKKEIDMALKLVNQLTQKFKPENFQDEYTKQLVELIESHVKSHTKITSKKESTKKSTKIHDITALLEASLKANQPKKTEVKSRKKKA